jgi:predicted nucleic acid-binding protein
MIVLDTNVLSELMCANPEPAVEDWLSRQVTQDVFITAITEAELRYGVLLMPAGRRRAALSAAMDEMLAEDFHGRILPFDSLAAVAYAKIGADRRRAGRPISQSDAQIAGTALSRGAVVVTRNVDDFEGCGVAIVNPWTVGR